MLYDNVVVAWSSSNELAITPEATPTPQEEQSASTEEVEVEEDPAAEVALNPDVVFNVVLVDKGEDGLKVVAAVRDAAGLDLSAASDLANSAIAIIAEQFTLDDAEALKASLEEIGRK